MLNKRQKYGDDWDVPSAEHPAGACTNRSAPGVEDGSYFEKSWVNDLMSLPGAIMNAAGYTPNGTEDTATASQVFDALVNGRWSPIANYTKGTIVTAPNGNQYYCNKANGRDSSISDPSSDATDTWREYPYKTQVSGESISRIYFDGRLEIEMTGVAGLESSPIGTSLPFDAADNFTPSNLTAQLSHYGSGSTDVSLNSNHTFGQKEKIFVTTGSQETVNYKALLLTRWA